MSTRRGRRAVTMLDVAAAAGVSDATVSNVLSGRVAVSPRTRESVMKAVSDLGYQLNVAARGLRTGRTGFITLAIPSLAIDYFTELADAVLLEAAEVGWSVLIQPTGFMRERELAVVSGADQQLSDGVLFHPHALGQEDRGALGTDRPMVLLGERMFGVPVDHVTMANTAAAEAMTRHLVDTGRRRIAVIGPNRPGLEPTAATLRMDGYRRALAAAGIPFRIELIAEAPDWKRADGAAGVEALLARRADFDALFCFNDTLAFGALHALTTHGLRVPQDIAVVGFDDVPGAAYSIPPLTTVNPGCGQIARLAVQRLVLRAHEGLTSAPEELVADYRLVHRASDKT